MSEETKLKPCPFCGGEVKMTGGLLTPIYMVYCEKCGMRTSFEPASERRATTVAAWNRRGAE